MILSLVLVTSSRRLILLDLPFWPSLQSGTLLWCGAWSPVALLILLSVCSLWASPRWQHAFFVLVLFSCVLCACEPLRIGSSTLDYFLRILALLDLVVHVYRVHLASEPVRLVELASSYFCFLVFEVPWPLRSDWLPWFRAEPGLGGSLVHLFAFPFFPSLFLWGEACSRYFC